VDLKEKEAELARLIKLKTMELVNNRRVSLLRS